MDALNIFVLGLDEENLGPLRDLPDADRYRFHQLLSLERLIPSDGEVDIRARLREAQQVLEEFDGPVDAVVGYWDFPISCMVPILSARLGGHCPRLEAVVACEHKYWSRVEQSKVIDEHPRFAAVDLDAPGGPPDDIDFPMWLKPVKSASSDLAFRVENRQEYDEALTRIRDGIDWLGKPFEDVMALVDLPEDIAAVGGRACLAEEEIKGRQVTVEGYVTAEDVVVYGVIDSVTYPGHSSFLRYQYPAGLPDDVTQRMVDASTRVIRQIGLTSSTFNVEYFWDPDSGAVNLVEVNPRHSQAHARLFELVDGFPNHQAMVRLALGEDPALPKGEGGYDVAAKWFLRRFRDGVVRRAPTPDDVRDAERTVPGSTVSLAVEAGDRLADLPQQDSYSFEVGHIDMGAADEAELLEKYEQCTALLPFEIDDLPED